MARPGEYQYISNVPILLAQKNIERFKAGLPPLTQQDIQRATGLNKDTITRWMRRDPLVGVKRPTVTALAKFFGVEHSELYEVIPADEGSPSRVAAATALSF
jgi:hypothetical protein